MSTDFAPLCPSKGDTVRHKRVQELVKALSRMDEQDRKLLLSMAEGMARRGGKR